MKQDIEQIEIEEKDIEKDKDNKKTRKNDKDKKGKKKGRLKKVLIVLAILFVMGVSGLGVLLYGPYNGFRDWLITTSMTTMTHQWIAKLFYDDEMISTVLYSNRVDEINEDTDTNAIEKEMVQEVEEIEYENEYERQILEKDPENDGLM